MTSLIKFELGKILRNRTVFGGIVVGCLVLLGIFFVGYHYSQLSMSEASNKKKGFEKSLDVIIDTLLGRREGRRKKYFRGIME